MNDYWVDYAPKVSVTGAHLPVGFLQMTTTLSASSTTESLTDDYRYHSPHVSLQQNLSTRHTLSENIALVGTFSTLLNRYKAQTNWDRFYFISTVV